MLEPEIRGVVGIDVAKRSHVVCALEVPSGAVREKALKIDATAAGYAALRAALARWGDPGQLLIGVEATGSLWEPLYDALTRAGYRVVVLNPRQTAAWAAGLGLRAKTDGLDAQTLARGVLAGYARASVLPSETVQALRELTRARRDLVESQTAARQRLQDERVVVFPELPGHTPDRCDRATPAVLHLLGTYGSAQALAAAPLGDVAALLAQHSGGRWGAVQARAQALQNLATGSAASTRAVAARALVVRTFARHLLDLQVRIAELQDAIAAVLRADDDGRRLRRVPGSGPLHAATSRAERGDVARFASVDQVVASRRRRAGAPRAPEWRVRRPSDGVPARPRGAAPRALPGHGGGGAVSPRVADALPAAARPGSGEERSPDQPLPRPAQGALSPAPHRRDRRPDAPGACVTATATTMTIPLGLPTSPVPPESPSRHDGVTIAGAHCGRRVPRVGRRRCCSEACRQAAFRRRQQVVAAAPAVPTPPRPAPRAATVYECPACGTRFLGEQRCAACNVFCRRIGLGGHCPHCDEPVAVADLMAHEGR